MLPVNPNHPNPAGTYQKELREKIDQLNNLEAWGSWDVVIVPETEIWSIANETLKSLDSSPNTLLGYSLLELAKRIKLDDYSSPQLRNLADQIQTKLATSSLFPIDNDSALEILERTGLNELSNVSKVSRDAKVMGEEIKLKKEEEFRRKNQLKKELFKICSRDVRFLLDGFHRTSKIVQFFEAQRKVTKELKERRKSIAASELNEEKIKWYENTFKELKNLPVDELINLCLNIKKNYRPIALNLKDEILSFLETKIPFGIDKKSKDEILFYTLRFRDLGVLELLVKEGGLDDSLISCFFSIKGREDYSPPRRDHEAKVIDLLNKALKSK